MIGPVATERLVFTVPVMMLVTIADSYRMLRVSGTVVCITHT